jgi:acyl CoA:acetate/3-ketoacid CoA transferase alpha subunit
MKNRITKFYDDHKIAVASLCVGLVVGTVVTTKKANRVLDGMTIIDATGWLQTDVGITDLLLSHKDGNTTIVRHVCDTNCP